MLEEKFLEEKIVGGKKIKAPNMCTSIGHNKIIFKVGVTVPNNCIS